MKYQRAEQKEEIISSFQKWVNDCLENFTQWRQSKLNSEVIKAHITESGFEISGISDEAIQIRILFLALGIRLY